MNFQVASFLGAVLAAVVTVWVTERARTRVERRQLATALYAELMALWEYHREKVGRPLEDWTQGLALRLAAPPLTDENLFPVYNANLNKLGLFPPQDAALLVRVHVEVKEYLESLRQAAETLQHDRSQHAMDELGHRLQRDLAQGRETYEQVARMLRRHAQRLWSGV